MWPWMLAGTCAMAAGLGLQLAMVAGAIAPGLVLSLGGYALLLAGMMLVLIAVLRMVGRG
jgi:hypothetical protein